MKAVVLVGGEGTRLRPLTETVPKPLVPFMNRAFLHHALDLLASHGVDEVILSSPYLESQFRSFLRERRGDPAVAWITEESPLGTCGAIVGAEELLDDTFLVCNGDILTDLDLSALVAFHRQRGSVATIALTRVDDARPFGLVETEDDGRVRAFREKPTERVPGTVNAGTYVLEPRALEGVPGGVAVSIERETFPDLIERGEPVYAYVGDAYWRDLGTPESYVAAHVDALAGKIRGIAPVPALAADDAEIDPAASLGEGVVLGRAASILAGAVVERTILHAGARIGRDAKVEGSVLGPESEVGDGALVRDTVLGDGGRIVPGARVDGQRIRPGEAAG